MKTLKTILTTIILTLTMGIVSLFVTGLIKVQKVEQNHNVSVIIDGKEVAQKDFIELYGYTVSMNINEAYYVGK